MTEKPHIETRGRFVPQMALAIGQAGESALSVHAGNPLPVQQYLPPAASEPLTGTAATDAVLGPFYPAMGRSIWLTLSGDWTGKVTVLRSADGGITQLPLTIGGAQWASFSDNVQEAIGEESVAGAGWYLAVTLSSGSVDYEVRQ
ncbi:hypothetical protein [Altericroceibacterium endophyticum]|uniref:DUF2793 domain-containing protein n=1 Tax=Altericroceibacterium endophyticum TaxID=1808508 RepID=A0A6I4T229_9SPHN|nr:hypothetical protein [Altericroceibacterium endophyticum]MXO64153.1 hypothetical protein [Altericroceibacterium endophyticum]